MVFRALIIILITISSILSHAGFVYAAREIELVVTSDKNEYTLTDPIYLVIKLKNKGKKPIYVNKRMYVGSEESKPDKRDIYITAIAPGGKKLPCKVSYDTGFPRTDHFLLLSPGDEIERDRKQGIKHFFDFDTPGRYKITATYENVYGDEIGVDAFKKRIKSKPITIKIQQNKKEEVKK